MKNVLVILILFFFSSGTKGQDFVEGQLLTLGKNRPVNTRSQTFKVTLYANHKYLTVNCDSVGRFKFERSKVSELGPTLNFEVGMSSTLLSYADFELQDIPLDSIDLFVKKIFVTKAYISWRCGNDCYDVKTRRTYWRRHYLVDTGQIKYRVSRFPQRGLTNDPLLEVGYRASCRTDIVR